MKKDKKNLSIYLLIIWFSNQKSNNKNYGDSWGLSKIKSMSVNKITPLNMSIIGRDKDKKMPKQKQDRAIELNYFDVD